MALKEYYRDKNGFLVVNVSKETLKKYCLWTITKFKKDQHHQQQNSSRSDLLGGFLDRWLNRIPEFLIFKALLDENNKELHDEMGYTLSTVNDNFFYNQESAKNAPDIIGLVKQKDNGEKEYFGFATFNYNQWDFKKQLNAPFIEMKTFRESQKLVTIPESQFKPWKYYAIVSSNIYDDYLIYLLDEDIFNRDFQFESENKFIKQNDAKILGAPDDTINEIVLEYKLNLSRQENIGSYKLLGIYDGKTIEDFSILAKLVDEKKPEKPRYLSSIEVVEDKYAIDMTSGIFKYHVDAYECIPIILDIENHSKLSLLSFNEKSIVVLISGKADLYNFDGSMIDNIEDGCYEIKFKESIKNLIKYYSIDSIHPTDIKSIEDEILDVELKSGVYSHYGNDYRNNQFDVGDLLSKDFRIHDFTQKSLTFSITNNENNKSYYKYSFNDNGKWETNDESEDNFEVEKCDDKNILKEDLDTFDLSLNVNVGENSNLKFIKRNKGNLIVCIEGTAEIKDDSLDVEPFCINDGYYEFVIYNGTTRNTNPGFDLRKPTACKKPEYSILKTDVNGFYFPDKNNEKLKSNTVNNVKFKVDESEGNIEVVEIGYSRNYDFETYYKIIVNGKVVIDGEELEDNSKYYKKYWKLKFDKFDRSSKKEEYVLSKGSISYNRDLSREKDLIESFIHFAEDDKNLLK